METYKNSPALWQAWAVKLFGVGMLLGGIAMAVLGPLEIYCFYLFAPGGPFNYEGFGLGSFMFGLIAAQIVGYYLLGIILGILGYGHILMKRWLKNVTLAILWAWLVVGGPIVIVLLFILVGTKDMPGGAALFALVFFSLCYLLFPWLLIRAYNSPKLDALLAITAEPSWQESMPCPILTVSVLHLFFIVIMHLLMLYKGLYPVFGHFASGLQGFVLLDISILILSLLVWGSLRRRRWAWWGSLFFYILLLASAVITFQAVGYPALLKVLAFPPREMEFLGKIPVQGYHLSVLAGIPLALTWLTVLLARRSFQRN